MRSFPRAAIAAALTCLASFTGLTALAGCHPAPSHGTIEERLARLEAAHARDAEALEFLNKVYEQQKAQQAREREEASPDAMFAVDIAPDLKAGQVEGSPQALVTIVEAWDFA